jgi:hypothetical protein
MKKKTNKQILIYMLIFLSVYLSYIYLLSNLVYFLSGTNYFSDGDFNSSIKNIYSFYTILILFVGSFF